MGDIRWEIRVVRTVGRDGVLRYDELVRRSGDTGRTSAAVKRLVRAGYLMEEIRLRLTADGRKALERLDDPEIRAGALRELLYGPHPDAS